MSSSLASQLKRIALGTPAAPRLAEAQGRRHAPGALASAPRGKPSLLFTPTEAADLDLHAILQLSLQGTPRVRQRVPYL